MHTLSFCRYYLQTVFYITFSVFYSISGCYYLLTSSEVRFFLPCLQPSWYYTSADFYDNPDVQFNLPSTGNYGTFTR